MHLFVLNLIQNDFVQIDLNKNDLNKAGGEIYVYRKRKRISISE